MSTETPTPAQPPEGLSAADFAPPPAPPVVDPNTSRVLEEGGSVAQIGGDSVEPSGAHAGVQADQTVSSSPEARPLAESTVNWTPDEEIERQARLATDAALQAVAASAAAQKMEALSTLMLDAADLANRSATTSTSAGSKLMDTHAALQAELDKVRKHSKIVLGVAGGVSVISLLLTAAIITQVSSRMSQLDATVLAVGKRYVEMTAGLESLTVLNDSLAEMQAKQEAYGALQAKLAANLEEANKASQGLVTQVPQATAKEVQARTQALMQQVQSIDARVRAQAGAVTKMAEEVKAMQSQNDNVAALKRDVQALVVLQKERYLEAAKSAGVAPRGPVVAPPPPAPRTVQYPRPQPPAPEGAAPETPGR